jgi:ABC-type nitrate/sulfonate/bicarbonate transport system ATPase subunit
MKSADHSPPAIVGTALLCEGISKEYVSVSGRLAYALRDVSFSVAPGVFLTIVGPSGSGKTTLLKVIAGIEPPSRGAVRFGAEGSDARIGMVFQGNSVFPWRTVERNLTYGLEAEGAPARRCRAEAPRLCQLVGLDPDSYLGKYPRELSGGELRRVAIGMALSVRANILLFDEPTSQLDYVSKLQIGQTVQALAGERLFTSLYVTHDIDEAILLGDRVIFLEGGRVKDDLLVHLPRPRTIETLATMEFAALRKEAFGRFERGLR